MTKQIVQLILTMSVVAFPKLHFKWLEVQLMKFTHLYAQNIFPIVSCSKADLDIQ